MTTDRLVESRVSAPIPRDRLSERAKWAILAGITIAFVALMFACAEGALRVRQAMKYGSALSVDDLYRVDERIGLRVPIANLDTGRISTNSLGFRGPEIALPKLPGTVRIAFLGASTTWCGEVSSNEHTWPHLVTQDLRARFPGLAVDYVNAGVPGYVVNASFTNLVHRVAPLEPDIIVIYHATNDMSRELRGLAAAKGLWIDGALDPGWVTKHSLLANLADKNLRIWLAQARAERHAGRLEVDATLLGDAFRRDLESLVVEARRHAKMVLVATFATQLRQEQAPDRQLQASASALYYMPFMTPEGLLASYRRYNDIIREVARDQGAVLVDGEDRISADPEHFADSVHFTDRGSRAMADRVSRVLSLQPWLNLAARRGSGA